VRKRINTVQSKAASRSEAIDAAAKAMEPLIRVHGVPQHGVPQMLFGLEGEDVIFLAPGVPDGVENLSLDQAVEKLNRPAEGLIAAWQKVWGRMVKGLSPTPPASRTPVGKVVAASPAAPATPPPPATSPAATPAVGLQLDPEAAASCEDAIIRILHFPELGVEDYAAVKTFAVARSLDLLSRHVWARRSQDRFERDRGERLHIGLTIEGFRVVAHRTQVYGGREVSIVTNDQAGVIDNDKPGDFPYAATCVVTRRVDGDWRPFSYTAHFAEYYDFGTPYRDEMPRAWLGKVAEAGALRAAFPNELGGVYSPEEMARHFAETARRAAGQQRRANLSAADLADEPGYGGAAYGVDESPQEDLIRDDSGREITSRSLFLGALAEWGVESAAEREAIATKAASTFGKFARQGGDAAVWQAAAKDVRSKPARWGIARAA
jgi:hypothetical protein